jgi:hypothetical protein
VLTRSRKTRAPCSTKHYRKKTIVNAYQATIEIWKPGRQNGITIAIEAMIRRPDSFQREELQYRPIEKCHTDEQAGIESSSPSLRCGELPRICCNGRPFPEITSEAPGALQAANDPPVLFARSGTMVAVSTDEKQCQVVADVGVDALCGRLARSANYFRVSASGGELECTPPLSVVKDILALARGEYAGLGVFLSYSVKWFFKKVSEIRGWCFCSSSSPQRSCDTLTATVRSGLVSRPVPFRFGDLPEDCMLPRRVPTAGRIESGTNATSFSDWGPEGRYLQCEIEDRHI